MSPGKPKVAILTEKQMQELADEVAQLQAENERLREALYKILAATPSPILDSLPRDMEQSLATIRGIVYTALKE